MPWFKIDDGFHGHPKVMNLEPADVGVWTLAGTWCAQYLTDGQISFPVIRRLGGTQANCDALVSAGMWIAGSNGTYEFKDWADYQPMKSDVEAEREASRERMRKVRAKRKGTSQEASEDVQANIERSSEEVRLTPTQPDPARPDPLSKESDNATKPSDDRGQSGTRIPSDFHLTNSMTAWALEWCPNLDAKSEISKFKDYYRAVAGRNQFRTDWEAAWRLWMTNSQERITPPRTPSTPTSAWDRKGVHGYEEGEPA